jgi:short-subunit dehydrogenase
MASTLAKQVVLITGASAGIGAALALRLATQYSGIRLILAARRLEPLEALAVQCRNAGADVLVVPTDLTQPDQVQRLVDKVHQQFGRVDVLVNNAGYGQMGAIELVSSEAAQRQFQVNLLGPLSLIRTLIPTMRAQKGGRIINVSSIAGRIAFPMGGLYSASKFALEGLSDALRMELEPFNIHVSVVEPGPVETEFVQVAKQQAAALETDPMQSPYRAAFRKLENLDAQIARMAWSSDQVATVIIKALNDRRPRPRYIAATGGNILVALMTRFLPTRIVDRFWQRFYGIDLVAQDWQQSQTEL